MLQLELKNVPLRWLAAMTLLVTANAVLAGCATASEPLYYGINIVEAEDAPDCDGDRKCYADLSLGVLAKQARAGDKHAQLELGIRFEEGRGVEVNRDYAKALYTEAAKDTQIKHTSFVPNGSAVVPQTTYAGVRKGLEEAKERYVHIHRTEGIKKSIIPTLPDIQSSSVTQNKNKGSLSCSAIYNKNIFFHDHYLNSKCFEEFDYKIYTFSCPAFMEKAERKKLSDLIIIGKTSIMNQELVLHRDPSSINPILYHVKIDIEDVYKNTKSISLPKSILISYYYTGDPCDISAETETEELTSIYFSSLDGKFYIIGMEY